MAGSLPVAAQVMLGAVLGFKIAKVEGKQLHSSVAAAARGAVQGGASCAASGEGQEATNWEPLESFEVLLNEIKVGAGLDQKPSITQAKDLLRDKGAGRLASRLGKFSQFRNAAGHLDVSLRDDIQKVFEGEQEASHADQHRYMQETEIHKKFQGIELQLEGLGAKLEQVLGLQVKPTMAIGEKQTVVDSETASADSDGKTSEAEVCDSAASVDMDTTNNQKELQGIDESEVEVQHFNISSENADPETQEYSDTIEVKTRELLLELSNTATPKEYLDFLTTASTPSQREFYNCIVRELSTRKKATLQAERVEKRAEADLLRQQAWAVEQQRRDLESAWPPTTEVQSKAARRRKERQQ